MTDIFLDPNTNDIKLDNQIMRLTTSIEELSRQRVQIWLGIFKGEWFVNILAGIPYLSNDNNPEQLLGVTSKETFDLAIKTGITTRSGIVELLSYSSTLDNSTRVITISFEASTETGEIVSINNITVGV
jgi:hypothetical protein